MLAALPVCDLLITIFRSLLISSKGCLSLALQLAVFLLCVLATGDGCANPCFLLLTQSTHAGSVSEQLNRDCDILPNEDHTCAYSTDVDSYSCFLLTVSVPVVSLINVILY